MSVPGRKSIKSALIIMARLPEPGRVKTRLGATLGDEFAAHFYRLCAAHIIQETLQLQKMADRYLFYDGQENETAMRHWLGPGLSYRAQSGENLGQRLTHAFQVVFAAGVDRAVIIGSDIPDLSAGLLRRAFSALEIHDAVIGPAMDGGYYLLGMRQLHPELFTDIAWSTGRVLAQTRQRMAQLKLSAFYLPALRDIDTEADLRQWVAADTGDDNPLPAQREKKFENFQEAIKRILVP